MNDRKDLVSIVKRFESVTMTSNRSKRARQALAHEIDDFLEHYQKKSRTPTARLNQAHEILSRCNLPLTNYIFIQESGIEEAINPDHNCGLEISPPVSISIIAKKKKYRSEETQFCSIDMNSARKQAAKMLEGIKDELSNIAVKHQKYKEKQRKIKILCQCSSSDNFYW